MWTVLNRGQCPKSLICFSDIGSWGCIVREAVAQSTGKQHEEVFFENEKSRGPVVSR
jgi:hypothetical protein